MNPTDFIKYLQPSLSKVIFDVIQTDIFFESITLKENQLNIDFFESQLNYLKDNSATLLNDFSNDVLVKHFLFVNYAIGYFKHAASRQYTSPPRSAYEYVGHNNFDIKESVSSFSLSLLNY